MIEEKLIEFIRNYFDAKNILINEAEYQGRKVTLDKPFRLSGENKKFGVYVKNDKGNVVIVKFGDPNMSIKRSNPERRKAFLSRHDCENKNDKTTAGYWSCKWAWSKNKDIS